MRIKIPRTLKEKIIDRQENKCALCLSTGKEFHHVLAVALGGKNGYYNLVLLCKKHHTLFHLGDSETTNSVYEYIYYLLYGKMCDDPYSPFMAEQLLDELRRKY